MLFLLLATLLGFTADGYRIAQPGYVYRFPFDQGSHDDYKSEWWYYTGHLFAADGREWGYELTFFRIAMLPPSERHPVSRWDASQLYLTHFAVTDVKDQTFRYWDKLNRHGIDTAGADPGHLHVYNDGWTADDAPDGSMTLRAQADNVALRLHLSSPIPPVLNGEHGISVKGPGASNASHYYSYTRLDTTGTLSVGGAAVPVNGHSWMDHEFGSSQLSVHQSGWDWFAVQLDDGCDLMLYQMRDEFGRPDSYSSGTLVDHGHAVPLQAGDFSIRPQGHWHSPHSGADYPMGWVLELPRRHLSFTVKALVDDQELMTDNTTGVTYWEGTASVQGAGVQGRAYVEMTGYAGRVHI